MPSVWPFDLKLRRGGVREEPTFRSDGDRAVIRAAAVAFPGQLPRLPAVRTHMELVRCRVRYSFPRLADEEEVVGAAWVRGAAPITRRRHRAALPVPGGCTSEEQRWLALLRGSGDRQV